MIYSLTPGPGYLEALVEENVDFVSNPIKRITETGIETVDGNHREYDTIVTATGFDTSYKPRIPISKRFYRPTAVLNSLPISVAQ